MRERSEKLFLNRMLACVAATLAVLLLLGGTAFGQAQGAQVRGTVMDKQGLVLPGATVSLRNLESGVTTVDVTDGAGQYRFAQLQPGRYGVSAELTSFTPVSIEGIDLTIGFVVTQDFELQIQTVEETITVTAVTPVVDVTQIEVSAVVTQEQIETLPINSRNYLSLALLLPGTSQDSGRAFFETVNVGGSYTFNSTVNAVDGVMNNWAEDGEPRQNLPEAAVEEFKINQSQYPAGYGLATGGIVQVVTKSGTNSFSGEAFWYVRDKTLNALNHFEEEKPDMHRDQFGASLGGPIVRDRTHFFFTVERTDLAEFHTVNTGRPDLYSSVEGTFENPGFTNMYFGRVDHQISNTQTLFARYSQEDAVRTCQGCGGTRARSGWDQDIPRKSLVVGHTWTASDNLLNDFRFQAASAIWRLGAPGTTIWTDAGQFPPERFEEKGQAFRFPSMRYFSNTDSQGPESRYEIRNTISMQLGTDHDLRFGGEYSHMPYLLDGTGGWAGTWEFDEDQFFDPNNQASIDALRDPILFSATRPFTNAETPSSYWGAFIQDEWRPRSNLTVNAGIRYEQLRGLMNERLCGNLQNEPEPLPALYGDLGLDPCERSDFNNFGPRGGISWDVNSDGQNTIRGGYGLYYNHIRLLGNSGEQRNLRTFNVFIPNPAYPDPFGGQDPDVFASNSPPNLTVIANDYVQPYSQQLNFGYSRQISPDMALHLDVLYTRSRNQRKFFDLNNPDPETGARPRSAWTRIEESRPEGKTEYGALYARLDKRYSDNYQFTLSYTLAKADDNLPLRRYRDQLDKEAEYGPANGERRHVVVASGAVLLPYDVNLGVVWTYRSDLPFSATAGRDLNFNGRNEDLVPGTTRNQGNRDLDLGAVNAWRAQFDLDPVPESQIESTKLFNLLDLRLSKTFDIAGTRLEALIQVFNLFNRVNLKDLYSGGNVSNALSANFGRIFTSRPARQAEVALRFRF